MSDTKIHGIETAIRLRVKSGLSTTPDYFILLEKSIENDKIKFILNTFGEPAGYIIWASVDKYTLLQIVNHGIYPRFGFEWRSGNITFLLDIVVLRNYCNLYSALRDFTKSQVFLSYIKKGKCRILRKRKNDIFYSLKNIEGIVESSNLPEQKNTFSIIIPIKFESAERERNFYFVVNYLIHTFPNAEIIIVSHNESKIRADMLDSLEQVRIVQTDTSFNRSQYLNWGEKEAKNNILFFYDGDCLANKRAVNIAVERLLRNQCKMVFPYNDFISLNITQTNLFLMSAEVETLFEPTSASCLVKLSHQLNGVDYKHTGGLQMMRKETFSAIGGFNENIVTWGGEDTELLGKLKRLYGESAVSYLDEPLDCYHLYHPRPKTDWNSSYMDLDRQANIFMLFDVMSNDNFNAYLRNQKINTILDEEVAVLLRQLDSAKKTFSFMCEKVQSIKRMLNYYSANIGIKKLPDFDSYIASTDNQFYEMFSNIVPKGNISQIDLDKFLDAIVPELKEQLSVIESNKNNLVAETNRLMHKKLAD